MKPILYPSTETTFSSNGLGILADAASCVVTEERNGAFELEMTYPVSGIHYGEIKARCLVMAKPNPVDVPQPFRIYRITRPMGGMVTVYGEHISYDLAGIPVSPFSAGSAAEAMQKLKSSSAVENPFNFWTDKNTAATMKVSAPTALRSLLGGREGSVLDTYGGEYAWDGYTVRLYGQRGENRGVSIRYGKNLTDLEQDENIASVYTGVYPYWVDMDGNLVQLPEKTLPAPGTYDFTRIMTLDLSSEFETAPTEAQIRSRAEAYMKANNIGVPKISLSVSFVPLEQTEEYKDLALLERVELCDAVNVEFPSLGVSATAKCIRTVYDVLLDRYQSVELGDARTNIATTIAEQQQKLEQAPTITAMKQAVDSATAQITGGKGGYVVLHSSTGAKQPDEILIMDTPDIATATKVWRWNKAGLGYSGTGYNGPYGLAMTQDGAIVADFITAGTLSANIIKAGTISSKNNNVQINLDSGNFFIWQKINGQNIGFIRMNDRGFEFIRNNESMGGLKFVETAADGIYAVANAKIFNGDVFRVNLDDGSSPGYLQLDKENRKAFLFCTEAWITESVKTDKVIGVGGADSRTLEVNGNMDISGVIHLFGDAYSPITIRDSSGSRVSVLGRYV